MRRGRQSAARRDLQLHDLRVWRRRSAPGPFGAARGRLGPFGAARGRPQPGAGGAGPGAGLGGAAGREAAAAPGSAPLPFPSLPFLPCLPSLLPCLLSLPSLPFLPRLPSPLVPSLPFSLRRPPLLPGRSEGTDDFAQARAAAPRSLLLTTRLGTN